MLRAKGLSVGAALRAVNSERIAPLKRRQVSVPGM